MSRAHKWFFVVSWSIILIALTGTLALAIATKQLLEATSCRRAWKSAELCPLGRVASAVMWIDKTVRGIK